MIRLATEDDVEAVTKLGVEFHQRSKYAEFSYNEDKVLNFIHTVITFEHGVAYVYENAEGKIVGAILGWISYHWFGDDMMLTDLGFFIEENERGGIAAMRLLKKFIEHGKAAGCRHVMSSNSSGFQMDRVAKLFEKSGMERYGYVYSMSYDKD